MTTTQLRRHLLNKLRKLSDALLEVEVCSSGPESETLEGRIAEFASNAAAHIGDCIVDEGVETVGVGWGYTVAIAIEMLQERGIPEMPAGRSITFLPTCGEPERPILPVNPSNLHNDQMSSTALAAALDRIFNRGSSHHLSLVGIPDFVGIGASDQEVEITKTFTIRQNAHWRTIFDDSTGTVGKLDAILTSVASPKQPNRQFVPRFEKETGVDERTIAERVIADIGGVWIPRHEGDPVVASWNKWWTGITYSHYANCAQRAALEDKPGVIVIAFGSNKAEVVLEVVRRGLVNSLVIDDSLACELLLKLGYPHRITGPGELVQGNGIESLEVEESAKIAGSAVEARIGFRPTHKEFMKRPRHMAFISYSHRDERWMEELQKQLEPLIANGAMEVWVDIRIKAGEHWLEEIKKALAATKVAVLLVSPDFLVSDFIKRTEFPKFLEDHKTEGITIFWIPIKHSNWRETPIVNFQAAHPPDHPLHGLSPNERGKAWVGICKLLKEALLRP